MDAAKGLFELGQIHVDSGDMNLWVVGAALIAFGLMGLIHMASGQSW